MIWVCVLVLAGGFAAQHSRLSLSSDISALLLVASLAMLGCRCTRYTGYFIFGLSWFLLAGQEIIENRLLPQFAGDSLLAEVRVVEFPRRTGHAVLLVVEPVNDPRLPPRSRVSWFEPPVEPDIGDVWQLELRLKRPRGLSNPGIFDREAWLFRNEIHASGYVVGGKRNRRLETATESAVDAFRRRFVARSAAVAGSAEAAAVLAAIAVGARHRVSREQWHRYAISGTSHLMAISGLHVGLAAGAAFLLARALTSILPLRANAHLVAVFAGVICASAYSFVSGMGVPAQRAVIMLLVAALAVVRRRNISAGATIALAAVVVFVMDPVATMAPGFHLSFAAVLLLLWLARCGKRAAGPRGLVAKAGHRGRQLLSIQSMLLFGLMPLTVLLFQRIALLALPLNLLAVPLFSLVTVPLTLVGLIPGVSEASAGAAALKVAAGSIDLLEALIAAASDLPFADITVAAIEGHGWLVVLLPAVLALLPRGWPGRYAAVIAVAALILQSPARPAGACIDAYVLDVGQGLATVVQTRSRTLVFDTGASFRGGGSVAEQVLVPFLQSRGLEQIDWLVVSHADIDHSGGVAALADYAFIRQLLAGEPLRESEPRAMPCAAGQKWTSDEVRFQVLHPPAASHRAGNDSSCVILIRTGRHSLLLTGDIEADAERQIIEEYALTDIDVVVVPHHGSLTSSSGEFVKAVAPEVAIVSSGFGNRWGFPKAAVSARWKAAGAAVLNTATSGAISFRLCRDGGLGPPRRDRHERRRFWRDGAG